MFRRLFFLGLTACLCGCFHPQKYNRPALPVSPAWPAADDEAAGAPIASALKWREFFIDERLQKIIEQALANNRDLRIAALNVEKVQSLYRIQRAAQFPTVSASPSAEVYRLPGNMASDGQAQYVGQILLGVGVASWEVDLFGRVRSLKSAALEQFLASEQAHIATQIALIGTVANSYLALGADRENLQLAMATVDAQQTSYELLLHTRKAGMASDLDVSQAQSQVEAARIDVARYSGQVELDENALNLLVGATVPAALLPDELGPARAFRDIAAGLPSDVLLRRPDILAAEHQLKASYANIDVARAAYFPRISLTSGIGLMSADLGNLFQFGGRTWSFAPQVLLPIFDARARKANMQVAQADRDRAIAEYERAIQSAFREVSDSLSLRTRLMEQQNAQEALVQSLEDAYRLSNARYRAGIDSYLGVLIAQRTLYRAQQGLVSLRMTRLGNLVTLYKVLGGGA